MTQQTTSPIRALSQAARQALAMAGDLILPRTCALCDLPTSAPGFCPDCLAELPGRGQARCTVCAIKLPRLHSDNTGWRCSKCTHTPPPFHAAVALADYAAPFDRLIQAAKYRMRPQLIRAAATCLAEQAATQLPLPRWPDRIMPMPLHASRLRERGFNQSAVAARTIARRWRVALDLHNLRRPVAGATQQSLPLARRHQNVAHAFQCASPLTGLRVALVDDVMTSGASLHWASHALRQAGAASVIILVLARTPAPRQHA